MMDPFDFRRRDLELGDDLGTVEDSFRDFFRKEVPITLVREAEPLGYDADLWSKAVEVGLTAMALPEDVGGDGAGVLELSLIAEQLGAVAAPIPLIEHVVASRLLVASGDPEVSDLVESALGGERILSFAPGILSGRSLVSTAAIGRDVVGFDGENLVVVTAEQPRPLVVNRASLPSAWVEPAAESVRVIASGDARADHRRARDEWDVLTGAALIGMTASSIEVAAEFARTRETQGILIGKLQGISFPLVDAHSRSVAGRNLARRAAWFLDNEPESERHLAAATLLYAADAAKTGITFAAHVQGGVGFTVDAATTPFFLRMHGWALAGGGLEPERRHVAEQVLLARRAERVGAPAISPSI